MFCLFFASTVPFLMGIAIKDTEVQSFTFQRLAPVVDPATGKCGSILVNLDADVILPKERPTNWPQFPPTLNKRLYVAPPLFVS